MFLMEIDTNDGELLYKDAKPLFIKDIRIDDYCKKIYENTRVFSKLFLDEIKK